MRGEENHKVTKTQRGTEVTDGTGKVGEAGFEAEDPLSNRIIGAAISVHKALGPGLLESVYHECIQIEFATLGIPYRTEVLTPIVYRGRTLKSVYRIDLLVDDLVIVELKAVDALLPVHDAQLLTYLRITNKRVGLLLNFKAPQLRNGTRRLVL